MRLGTTGKAVPGYELRLVDDESDDVKTGEHGELGVKGPKAAMMYWSNRGGCPATTGALIACPLVLWETFAPMFPDCPNTARSGCGISRRQSNKRLVDVLFFAPDIPLTRIGLPE